MSELKTEVAGIPHIAEIVELLRLMHAEGYPGTFSETKVQSSLADLMVSGVVLVTKSGGRIVGTVGLEPSQFPWSDDWHLADRFFYVHPDHRRSAHARTLLTEAKKIAKEAGIPLRMGIFGKDRLDAKIKLFRRIMGEPYGAIFFVEG